MHRSTHQLATFSLVSALLGTLMGIAQSPPVQPKPLAVVFGESISAEDIDEKVQMAREGRRKPFANPDEEAQWEKEQRQTHFAHELDSRLMLQYMAKDENLRPTADEIWEVLQAMWQQSTKQQLEDLKQIEAQLQTPELSDADRAKLEKRREGIARRLAEGKKFEKPLAELTPQERASIDTAGGIANGTIMFWKFNKSMHDKYGGDVILAPDADGKQQMFGPQAVEAVAKWVHELREKKDLTINDEELAKAFFEEAHPLDNPKAVPAPPGAFDQPPWRKKS